MIIPVTLYISNIKLQETACHSSLSRFQHPLNPCQCQKEAWRLCLSDVYRHPHLHTHIWTVSFKETILQVKLPDKLYTIGFVSEFLSTCPSKASMPQTKLRESAQKLVFESRTTDDVHHRTKASVFNKLAIRHHELSFSPIMLLFRQTQKFEHYLCLFLSDSQDSLFYIGCKLPGNYGVCLSSLTELVIQKRHQSFPS